LNISLPELYQILFIGLTRLSQRFSQLLGASLDPYDASLRTHLLRHQAGELSQPAPEIDNSLTSLKIEFSQAASMRKRSSPTPLGQAPSRLVVKNLSASP
jgi:hypothetical protein